MVHLILSFAAGVQRFHGNISHQTAQRPEPSLLAGSRQKKQVALDKETSPLSDAGTPGFKEEGFPIEVFTVSNLSLLIFNYCFYQKTLVNPCPKDIDIWPCVFKNQFHNLCDMIESWKTATKRTLWWDTTCRKLQNSNYMDLVVRFHNFNADSFSSEDFEYYRKYIYTVLMLQIFLKIKCNFNTELPVLMEECCKGRIENWTRPDTVMMCITMYRSSDQSLIGSVWSLRFGCMLAYASLHSGKLWNHSQWLPNAT